MPYTPSTPILSGSSSLNLDASQVSISNPDIVGFLPANYFDNPFFVPQIGTISQPIYRGLVGSVYVYSVGSPPGGGATDIVIIGYT